MLMTSPLIPGSLVKIFASLAQLANEGMILSHKKNGCNHCMSEGIWSVKPRYYGHYPRVVPRTVLGSAGINEMAL